MLNYDIDDNSLGSNNNIIGNSKPYAINNPKHIDLASIDKLTLKDYGLTPDDIKDYTFGVRIIDPDTGEEMDDAHWEHFIGQAVSKAEHALGITIFPRPVVREMHDYIENEYDHNNFIQTQKRPIVQVQQIELMFNNQSIVKYPSSMWKVYHLAGQLQVYPSTIFGGSGALASAINPYAVGINNNPLYTAMGLGMNSNGDIPQFCGVSYIAGMLPPAKKNMERDWEMPEDLRALISKYVLKDAIEVWGETILKPGIASTSVNADGLGEHIDAVMSAENTGATARNKLIDKEISELLDGLQNYYGSSDLIII